MDVTDYTVKQIILWHWHYPEEEKKANKKVKIDLLLPLRKWLDNFEINNSSLAHRICKLIPSQCPFARTIKVWGKTLLTIPPLCKINPVYDELMSLRFRALSYLAECGEDVSKYC
ncbi:MAG: nitrogenase [Gloeocapsa sp. DLM2.Bin57]|nr:MAG: nitrogenase [Gloeocapsa sp. DLM2.Bin57]